VLDCPLVLDLTTQFTCCSIRLPPAPRRAAAQSVSLSVPRYRDRQVSPHSRVAMATPAVGGVDVSAGISSGSSSSMEAPLKQTTSTSVAIGGKGAPVAVIGTFQRARSGLATEWRGAPSSRCEQPLAKAGCSTVPLSSMFWHLEHFV